MSVGLALLATACVTGRTYAPPLATVVDVPGTFGTQQIGAAPLDGWCSDFGAPELDALVDRALSDNLDLRAAWARLEQSAALARQAGAARLPTVDASASGSRARTPAPMGATTGNSFAGSLTVGYEVDLWGRLDANRRAADYDRLAARADAEAMAISLASRVADAWFDVVYRRQQLDLIDAQLETNQRYLTLLAVRNREGLATALDLNQQQQQIESLRARRPQVEASLATADQRLAVLLGRPPSEHHAGPRAALPVLPPGPDAGVPADLLARRPDVRAAGLRLRAADRRVAAAVAEKLPTLRLSASLSVQAAELSKLLDQVLWSVTGSLAQSVFDGGRRDAAVERADAAARERLFGFGQALLSAMAEVEAALVNEARQAERIAHLARQQATAEQTMDLARERYREGAVDYLRVLTTLQSLQQTEQELLDAQRIRISHRLQLCRAIGGDWATQLEPASDREDRT